MKLGLYLREKWVQFCVIISLSAFIVMLGSLMRIPKGFLMWAAGSFCCSWLLIYVVDYVKKRKFYDTVLEQTKMLDKKYLLSELLEEPDFVEGMILWETLREMTQSMCEHIGEYKRSSTEYKDYIEMWVHEIKLPIATGKMILENHKGEFANSLGEELDKIDSYTEQALYYARSNYVEKDYLLKRINLEDISRQVIQKNRKGILGNKISMDFHNLDTVVYSDSKWLVFIMDQILHNSIKYMGNQPGKIEWFAVEKKEWAELHLRDTGIGIPPQDVKRVFEKGFTGENGRNGKKSTGIGLYLCKKLCEKMGHKISVKSEMGKGCEVIISFPKGSMTGFVHRDS